MQSDSELISCELAELMSSLRYRESCKEGMYLPYSVQFQFCSYSYSDKFLIVGTFLRLKP